MKKILACLCLVVSYSVSAASALHNVTIERIGYDKNFPDVVFIRTIFSPIEQQRITCHTDNNWNYVLATASTIEEKMYSAILAAHASKQSISFIGSGLLGLLVP